MGPHARTHLFKNQQQLLLLQQLHPRRAPEACGPRRPAGRCAAYAAAREAGHTHQGNALRFAPRHVPLR